VGFLDHYLDVPVDLSKALFICTANDIGTISGPLRDRMEMIEISGYVTEEKVEIAKRYLIPKQHEETGITKGDIEITDESLTYLIDKHCRESGVRNLQKKIQRIFRKAAVKVVKGESVNIDTPCLPDYVGRAIWNKDRMYQDTPPGTVAGLAWTSMGGSALYVESIVMKHEEGKGGLKVTGNIKDVMKESSDISLTVARNIVKGTKFDKFFDDHQIHLHFPEGATPKDGPSAGVTITTALLSLATETQLPNVAMTGEISLNGMVHAVGGIKEKILAAKRAEIPRVFIPHDCQNAWDELDDQIKQNVDIVFVKHYGDIQRELFKNQFCN
jgi:Lon-like ATP-dependent protease